MAQIVKDSDFENVLNDNKVVMVDFWATWCGPCRMLSPTVDEVAQEYEGKVFVGKCDVDENDSPMKYGITNIPALLFFKDGELVDRIVGYVSKQVITEKLDSLL